MSSQKDVRVFFKLLVENDIYHFQKLLAHTPIFVRTGLKPSKFYIDAEEYTLQTKKNELKFAYLKKKELVYIGIFDSKSIAKDTLHNLRDDLAHIRGKLRRHQEKQRLLSKKYSKEWHYLYEKIYTPYLDGINNLGNNFENKCYHYLKKNYSSYRVMTSVIASFPKCKSKEIDFLLYRDGSCFSGKTHRDIIFVEVKANGGAARNAYKQLARVKEADYVLISPSKTGTQFEPFCQNVVECRGLILTGPKIGGLYPADKLGKLRDSLVRSFPTGDLEKVNVRELTRCMRKYHIGKYIHIGLSRAKNRYTPPEDWCDYIILDDIDFDIYRYQYLRRYLREIVFFLIMILFIFFM